MNRWIKLKAFDQILSQCQLQCKLRVEGQLGHEISLSVDIVNDQEVVQEAAGCIKGFLEIEDQLFRSQHDVLDCRREYLRVLSDFKNPVDHFQYSKVFSHAHQSLPNSYQFSFLKEYQLVVCPVNFAKKWRRKN